MYEYKGTVIEIYDGDTMTVDVDLGFHLTQRMTLRLARINTPEVRGEEREMGLAVRDYLRKLVPLGTEVIVRTAKTGKFGRYIAEVLMPVGPGTMNINDRLLTLGMGWPVNEDGHTDKSQPLEYFSNRGRLNGGEG